MEKKMENEMETGVYRGLWGLGFPKLGVPTIMENQVEKKIENEMETGII